MRSQITKPNRRTASKISCKALKIWTKKSGTRKKQTKPTQRSSGKTPGRAWKITFLRLECRRFSYLLPSHLVWTPALRNLECACSEAPLSPLVSLASDGKRTKRTIDERDRMAGLSAMSEFIHRQVLRLRRMSAIRVALAAWRRVGQCRLWAGT